MSRTVKNLLSFAAVLVLTVAAVAVLSTATHGQMEVLARQEVGAAQQEPAELSAVVPEDSGVNAFASVGAFLLIVTVPAGGAIAFWKLRKAGKKNEVSGRRYSPRADMTFRELTPGRSRV